MRSPICNYCDNGKAVVHCMIHSATFCLQCDYKIHLSDVMTMDNHNQSRFLLCSNCVSETGDVQCLGEGLYLCKTCVSNANVVSRFLLCNNSSSRNNNTFNDTSPTSPLDIFDLDSSSSSCSSSLIDPKKSGFSFVSLPFNNGDSSSAFGFSQNFDNYTKSYSDHNMLMPPPDILDIPKEIYCSGFNCYDTKEDVDNVWLNNFDGDLKEYFPAEELILTDQMNIDEITKHNAETTTDVISPTSTCMSSVTHKDYSMEALANASRQDYDNNQMIGSKAKEETDMNNLGLFPNTLAQLDCGPPHLILTDEMLSWDDQTLASNHVYTPRSRKEAVTRYLVKKKKRKFGKQIRYQSRKSTADTKRRFKGRFTKAGAKYDYDPGANNDYHESNKAMTMSE